MLNLFTSTFTATTPEDYEIWSDLVDALAEWDAYEADMAEHPYGEDEPTEADLMEMERAAA